MEFYDDSPVQLNSIRRIDFDYVEEPDNTSKPKTDKYGFTDGVTKTVEESSLPLEVLRERELKWIKMTKNWDMWMKKNHPKVKERCRKGIPPAVRGLVWQNLCGANKLKEANHGVFANLISLSSEWDQVIVKDLDRTFPFHDMFSKPGSGQEDLHLVLKAYSLYNTEVGYCQAMAPISAVLLMHMTTEDAFWCLVSLLEKYVKGYYGEKLEAVRLEGEIFKGLLPKVLPSVARHMEKFHIDPLMYMTEWFMCLYSRNLPFASVLRIWDMFFCEGVKVLFRTAFTILKLTLTPTVLKECEGVFETNDKLRNLPKDLIQEDHLIPEILNLDLPGKLIEREHKSREKKNREIVVR
ncbi:TBC1 domain family member 10A-like [Xenia sp. Carnegie-2017]|uniref:TBC1 domain family member 10A-like n=1 Tax=Xenia sp. Carnegie-2017 TaxID=2897299 RepID=UPI001F037F0E|nr:TBC1 domain family member 10A-like [Xenia sp. Carnegie-2017]